MTALHIALLSVVVALDGIAIVSVLNGIRFQLKRLADAAERAGRS